MAMQDTSIQHELAELSDQIHTLFFLSGGNCSQTQLDDYSDRLTHIVKYAQSLGFRLALLCDKNGIDVNWQPLEGPAL